MSIVSTEQLLEWLACLGSERKRLRFQNQAEERFESTSRIPWLRQEFSLSSPLNLASQALMAVRAYCPVKQRIKTPMSTTMNHLPFVKCPGRHLGFSQRGGTHLRSQTGAAEACGSFWEVLARISTRRRKSSLHRSK